MTVAAVTVLEDTMGCEQAQDSVEGILVDAAGRCEFADRHGPIPDAVSNAQFGDDVETAGCKSSGGERKNDVGWRFVLRYVFSRGIIAVGLRRLFHLDHRITDPTRSGVASAKRAPALNTSTHQHTAIVSPRAAPKE